MAYEYLSFAGILVLAALLGTGAGAIQNGSFSNHPETIVVNTVKPRTKRTVKAFVKRDPTLPKDFNWDSLTKATEIAKIPGVQYESRSYGDSLRTGVIYPHKEEWFKKGEECLKNAKEEELKSDELKEVHKTLKTADSSSLTGSKLAAWCKEIYKEEHLAAKGGLTDDIWKYCHVDRTK